MCCAAAAIVCDQAHAGDQQHAEADRHVHVGAAVAQRGQRGAEERHARHRRSPAWRSAPRPSASAPRVAGPMLCADAGPDADRDQHDVAGGEARRPPARAAAPARSRPAPRPARRRRTAPAGSPARSTAPTRRCGLRRVAAPGQAQPARGHVDAARVSTPARAPAPARSARRRRRIAARRPPASARACRPAAVAM